MDRHSHLVGVKQLAQGPAPKKCWVNGGHYLSLKMCSEELRTNRTTESTNTHCSLTVGWGWAGVKQRASHFRVRPTKK